MLTLEIKSTTSFSVRISIPTIVNKSLNNDSNNNNNNNKNARVSLLSLILL